MSRTATPTPPSATLKSYNPTFSIIFEAHLCYNLTMESKRKKHLIYPDIARGIGIILVVLAHIEYISLPARNFIVSFHMPLFFVISGILLNFIAEEKKDLKETASKKAKGMLLPYLYFSLIDTVFFQGYALITGQADPVSSMISNLTNTVTLYGISVLWFLPALYGSEMLFLLLRKKTAKPVTGLTVVVLTAAVIVLNNILAFANVLYGTNMAFAIFHLFAVAILRMIFCTLFLAAGYFAYPLMRKYLFRKGIFSLVTGLLLMLICFFISQLNGVTDLHYLVFNNIFLYLISSFSGVFGSMAISIAIGSFPTNIFRKMIIFYGRNSLTVMVTHLDFYIMYFAEVGGLHFTKPLLDTPVHDPLLSVLSLIFVLIAEVFVIVFINRFCPFLIGKKKQG